MTIIRTLKRFAAERSGNVAVMFALSAGTLLAGSAAAIDYSRYSNTRTVLLRAADAAAIAGARTEGTAQAREEAARRVFVANLEGAGLQATPTVTYRNISTNGVNSGYRVEATADVPAIMGSFTRTTGQKVATASQADASFDDPTEVVFVLDTTASMEGDRINALKSAVTGIIDDMTRRVPRPDRVKFGVVPFAQYVNVGVSSRSQPWMDVPNDYKQPDYDSCSDQRDVIATSNCRMQSYPAEPPTPASTCYNDGRPYSCGGSSGRPARTEQVCDYTYSEPRRVCTRRSGDWVRWHGCAGSRTYPLNIKDESYGTRIPGIMGVTCGSPVQDLTTNAGVVRGMVNGLVTNGETYIPSGLIWGWRMLSPGEPFNAAPGGPGGARKVMLLVTDGRNTLSPTYPAHNGTDSATADRLTREVCGNIAADRANAIKVYTIAFEVDGLDVKSILQNCASRTGGEFYDAANATALRASLGKAMQSIFGVKLTN
jgi:Flp pilus assembly protein TadG